MQKVIVDENDLDVLVTILKAMELDVVHMTSGNVSHHVANIQGVIYNMIQLIGDMKKEMFLDKGVLKELNV